MNHFNSKVIVPQTGRNAQGEDESLSILEMGLVDLIHSFFISSGSSFIWCISPFPFLTMEYNNILLEIKNMALFRS